MVLILYTFLPPPVGRALAMFMEMNKIPHEVREVNLLTGEQDTAEFRKVNPQGKIPVLDDDGFILTQSGTIMKYLTAKLDLPDHWYPTDIKLRARVDEAVAWQHSALWSIREHAVGIVCNKVLPPPVGFAKFDEERYKKDCEGLKKEFKVMEEKFLKNTPFLNSDDVTIADLLTACEIMSTELTVCNLVASYPVVQEYLERVKQKVGPYWDKVNEEARSILKESVGDFQWKVAQD